MKNPGFYILTVLILATVACKNTDEALSNDMITEYQTQEGKIKEATGKSKTLNEFGVSLANVPVGLQNDPAANIQQLHTNLTMLVNKYNATVQAHSESLTRLGNLQEDYNNGKTTTEETRQEFETLKTSFEGVNTAYERVDSYFKEQSEQYNGIVDTWKAAHPQEADAMKAAEQNPVRSGALSTAPSTSAPAGTIKLQPAPTDAKKKN